MKSLKTILVVLLFSVVAAAQGKTHLVRSTTSLPATCNPGNGVTPTDEVDLVSGGTTKHYICSATNTWTQIGGAQTWDQVGAGSNLNAQTMGTAGSLIPLNVGQVAASQVWLGLGLGSGLQAPTSTGTNTGGTILSAQGWQIQYTFQTAAGETLASIMLSGNTQALTSNTCVSSFCTLTINAPTFPSGVTGWNVYACDTSAGGCSVPQKIAACTNLAAGVNCTFTAPYGTATTGVPTINTAWVQPSNVQGTALGIAPPQGWIPSIFAVKADGNVYPVFGVDESTCTPLVSPCGVPMWIDRFFVNDTGSNIATSTTAAGVIKNNLVGFAHNTCNGTTCTSGNDDRLAGWRVSTPTSMTGSNNARVMGWYGEMFLNGTPTALTGGGPDTGMIGNRITQVDQRSGGTLNSVIVGFDSLIQGLQTGGANWGSCNPCGMGFRSTIQASGTGSIFTGYYAAVSGTGVGVNYYATNGGASQGNIGLYANSSFSAAAGNYVVRSDGAAASILGGTLYLPSLQSDAASLSIVGSTAVTGAVTTSQLTGLTASPACTAGSTNWQLGIVAYDSNNQSVSSTINVNSCVANLDATHTLTLSNLNAPGATSYAVYLVSTGGGTCNGGACTLGKVTTLTPTFSAAVRSPSLSYTYTGGAGDGTTMPSLNSTGGIQSAAFVQSTAKTFASLPACSSSLEGAMWAVTDSSTVTWGATITGGSTSHVLAYCNGTNWTVAAK